MRIVRITTRVTMQPSCGMSADQVIKALEDPRWKPPAGITIERHFAEEDGKPNKEKASVQK